MARDAGPKKVYFYIGCACRGFAKCLRDRYAGHSELIAHGRSAQEINQLIGADGLIYQELDDLVDAVRELNPDLRSFEDSVFSACYITKEVDDAYLEALARKRNDGAKQETLAESEDACLDLRADAS